MKDLNETQKIRYARNILLAEIGIAGQQKLLNSRVLVVGAGGVHLGQEDLPIGVARKIAPELIIGASSHNLKEALKAERDGADYVNIGPIFRTKTKADTGRIHIGETVRMGAETNRPHRIKYRQLTRD